MAGTATITCKQINVLGNFPRKVLTIVIVSGTDGAFTDANIDVSNYGVEGFFLKSFEFVPGGTPPNTGFTIQLKHANGMDLLQDFLKNIADNTAQQQSLSGYGFPMVREDLTLSCAGFGLTGAGGTLTLTLVAQP